MNKEKARGPNSEATTDESEAQITNGYDESAAINGRSARGVGRECETRGIRTSESSDVLTTDPRTENSENSACEPSLACGARTWNGDMSESVSSELSSEHSESQTLSLGEGEGRGISEAAVFLSADRNAASCSSSARGPLSSGVLDSISNPTTDLENNSTCPPPVVALPSATACTTGCPVLLYARCIVNSHSVSSSLGADVADASERDVVSRTTVPFTATSTLPHIVATSISTATAGHMVIPGFTATSTSPKDSHFVATSISTTGHEVIPAVTATSTSPRDTHIVATSISTTDHMVIPTVTATSTSPRDTHIAATSISTTGHMVIPAVTGSIMVVPAVTGSIPHQDSCVALNSSSCSLPIGLPEMIICVSDPSTKTGSENGSGSGSTSSVTFMRNSLASHEVPGLLGDAGDFSNMQIMRFDEGLLRVAKTTQRAGGKSDSLENSDTRNPGNVKQRYSDVPVAGELLCLENLDYESRSCMELSKDSESLEDLLKSADQKEAVPSSSGGVVLSIPSASSCADVGGGKTKNGERNLEKTHLDDPLSTKRYDRRSVTSISSDSRLETRGELPSISSGCIVTSQSTEKILGRPNACVQFFPGGIVRSSRSQENYFDSGDITCVDIDLDDNIASSVDALHYDTSSMASIDSANVPDWPIDRSESDLYLQMEDLELARLKRDNLHSAMPAFSSKSKALSVASRHDEPPSGASHGVALGVSASEIESAFDMHDGERDSSSGVPDLTGDRKQGASAPKIATATTSATTTANRDAMMELRSKVHENAVASEASDDRDRMDEDDEDASQDEDFDFLFRDENFFRQQTRDVDRPSAARLAKRLFFLHGFRKSDVSRHLSKKNSFSQLVGEEYLKYFDFSGEQLDGALRRFMKHMTMYGENQDRERLLAHFSCRYQQCNPGTFKSEDCCHTLCCALLLLNNDLNGQNIGRKITLAEFINNMADMNDGEQFPKELLKSLYVSVQNQPLEFEGEDARDTTGSLASPASTQSAVQLPGRFVTYNPFDEIPDPNNAVEFKKGYVMRKCCLEPDGRKTPLGKRGWKMFYAALRDMVLRLHINEHDFKRNQQYASATNAIHIHHSLATKATDYQKKNHVFRLQTADMAQYLVQTSDSKECQEWIDAVNFVAASYSAPSSSISSAASQKRFQRPLLPSTYTRLNLREQINHHEKMIADFDRELVDHRKNPPEKGAKTRLIQDYCKKENYLKFELKRYKTYCRLLQYKVSTFPELEPSLAEIAIGEVDEPSNSPPVEPPFDSSRCPKLLPPPTEFSTHSD